MEIVDMWDDGMSTYYTVEITKNIFVDVKHTETLCYVMEDENGCMTHNECGEPVGYDFDEDDVIIFILKEE